MILPLFATVALAADVGGGVGVVGQASPERAPGWEAAALHAHGDLHVTPKLSLELHGEGGWSGAAQPYAGARLGGRSWLGPPQPGSRWSAVFSYGVAWGGALRPSGLAGLALDLPRGERGAWRIEGGLVGGGLVLAGARLGVGWTRRPPAPEVAAPPEPLAEEPAPAPPPDAPRLAVSPDGARVWLPHPWCRWVPVVDGMAVAGPDARGAPARVSAPGFSPATVTLGEDDALALEPAPAQGSLLVVAAPGDELVQGEARVSVGADGVALLRAAEGPVTVQVMGGGRAATLQGAVSAGYATWLRAAPPAERRVQFAVNSARLDAAGAATLGEVAENTGRWAWVVRGGASPEGDAEANRALALRRAEACVAALTQAGVPEPQVQLEPEPLLPPADEPTDDPAAWRSCILQPVSPGRAP